METCLWYHVSWKKETCDYNGCQEKVEEQVEPNAVEFLGARVDLS